MSGSIAIDGSEPSVGEAGGSVVVAITRTGDLSGPATITYAVTPISATPGVDYTAVSGQITMQPGQSRTTVAIPILDDTVAEPTETLVFSITSVDSSSTLLFPRTARIAILDDENPVVDPTDPPLVSPYDVTTQPVVTGLVDPLAFAFSPVDSDILYIAEKGGRVRVFDLASGAFLPDFVDLTAKVNDTQDRGLLDIALHPNFPASPYVYAFYVVDPPDIAASGYAGPNGAGNRYAHLVRFTADAATGYTTMVPGSEVILVGGAGRSLADISGGGLIDSTENLTIPESGRDSITGAYRDDYIKLDARSHAGGSLAFGPDGALYVSIGDGTSFNVTDPRSVSVQNLDSLSGKILRIDPLTGDGLADNPFVAPGDSLDANRSKVYQLGLRNPFSMGFDADGHLFVTNTGWNSWEEIESGPPGANFGWPYFEGGDAGVSLRAPGYQDLPTAAAFYAAVAAGQITLTPAYRAFAHDSGQPGFQVQAITGGDVVYSGSRYPAALRGDYFFADVVDGEVYVVDTRDRRATSFLYATTGGPVHFSQGPDGYVYAADLFAGTIDRLLITTKPREAAYVTNGAATFDATTGVHTLATAGYQAGLVSSATRIDLSQNFRIAFSAFLGTTDAGGDGLAFVLHDDPAGNRALGWGGSGLGVGGLTDAIAFELDTYANVPSDIYAGGPDIAADHAGFLDPGGSFATTPFALPNLEDGRWHDVIVEWNAALGTLTARLDGQTVASLTADVATTFLGGSSFAYFGFGAGTGASINTHAVRIVDVQASFEGGPPPPPVVTDFTALLGGTSWSGIEVAGRPVIVTYSFPTTAATHLAAVPGYTAATAASFEAFSAGDQALARAALAQWAGAGGIVFLEVAPGRGDITFQHVDFATITDPATTAGDAFALRPSTGGGDPAETLRTGALDAAGDILVDTAAQAAGLVGEATLLAAIGRALGLKGPREIVTNTAADPDVIHDQVLASDDPAATIMASVFLTVGGTATLRQLDRDAIAFLHGAAPGALVTSDAAGSDAAASWSWNAATSTLTRTGQSGADTIRGTSVEDVIEGAGGDDALFGLAGDDTLSGGVGADTLQGGIGLDTASYAGATGAVVVDLAVTGGQAVGGGQGTDLLVDIENLTGGSFGDTLRGNALANRLDGGDGGDTLIGGAGDDTLIGGHSGDLLDGGADDDLLIAGAGDDTIIGGQGRDTADYSGFGGAAIVSLSIATAQNTNTAGTDTLSGIENIRGGAGNDKFTGTTGANTMAGGGGADQLAGIGGADLLMGEAGNDRLIGGAGADTLVGGAGRDTLVGGLDADIFRFTSASESPAGAGRDRLDDFVIGLDRIDLSAIDAVAGGADDAFTFIGTAAFSGAGQARFFLTATRTILEVDIDGGGADLQLELVGRLVLTSADLLL